MWAESPRVQVVDIHAELDHSFVLSRICIEGNHTHRLRKKVAVHILREFGAIDIKNTDYASNAVVFRVLSICPLIHLLDGLKSRLDVLLEF